MILSDGGRRRQLPATPSSIADDSESAIELAIEQPSPLLHTEFPDTPMSLPDTPIPSSNIYGRQTWLGGSGLNRLTVVSLPSQYVQSPRSRNSRDSKARSMSAARGQASRNRDGRDDETIALRQLVTNLRARVHELETQHKLLRDASWYQSSPPSYKSRGTAEHDTRF